jgi:AcrR family transcriptional regulator
MTTETGLRERKKAATRAALSRAAWSLMVETGLDAVTIEAVAEAVNVSPRTFRNYFSSREEAIVDALAQRNMKIVEKLRARPDTESVWDSLVVVLPSALTEIVGDRGDFLALIQAIGKDPAMLAQNLLVFERTRQLIAEVIAERTGTDADRDLTPRLAAGAVTIAIRASVELWARGRTDATLPDLVLESLAQLRAGLPLGAAVPAV